MLGPRFFVTAFGLIFILMVITLFTFLGLVFTNLGTLTDTENPENGKPVVDFMEVASACENVCPSSLNCTEWESCRFHYPDLCLGQIEICREGGDAVNVRPKKVVLILETPALQQYLLTKNTSRIPQEAIQTLVFLSFLGYLTALAYFLLRIQAQAKVASQKRPERAIFIVFRKRGAGDMKAPTPKIVIPNLIEKVKKVVLNNTEVKYEAL